MLTRAFSTTGTWRGRLVRVFPVQPPTQEFYALTADRQPVDADHARRQHQLVGKPAFLTFHVAVMPFREADHFLDLTG